MILCRRPITLYDADALGLAGVGLLAAIAWFMVASPWRHVWRTYQDTAQTRRVEQTRLRDECAQMEQYRARLAQVRDLAATELDRVPVAAALPSLLQQMTDLARRESLDIRSVSPQPARQVGAYVIVDVEMNATGRSLDFVRYLDELAQQNPHQTLYNCAVIAPRDSDQAACELKWMLRLYMLPASREAIQ